MTDTATPTVVGRYVLHAPIARGGMATIHLARLLGAEGFSRLVAAKRLHPQYVENAEFLKMFLDEARIASKVHHPNVVPMLDVVQTGAEVILVQEYVHGVPLDKLARGAQQQGKQVPIDVVVAIVSGMLAGLGAAHEAKDELGQPLGIVHRDVSPQNLLVGVDGIPRLVDFGVAKATLNLHVTRAGFFKGKLGYTSPELLRGVVTRATDIYASGVLLWEALAGRRLYVGMTEAAVMSASAFGQVPKLTDAIEKASVSPGRWQLLTRLEPVVSKATAFDMNERYATAAEMQEALLSAATAAAPGEVARWVKALGREHLVKREKLMFAEESRFRKNPIGVTDDEPPPSSAAPRSSATLRASVLSSPPERGRAHWPIVAALAFIGALLAGIFVLLWRRPLDAVTAATAATAAAPAAAPAPLAAPAAAPEAAPERASPEVPAASARAGASTIARPIARPRAPSGIRAAAAAPSDKPHVAAPSTDCSPPFYFDGSKKIFKPGCL